MVGFAQVSVELVEELAYVAGLRAETRTCACDDGRIQSQPLRDVDAGGRAGDADFQFISRLQRGFVKADGSVHHAGGIRGVDLERRVVRGDDGHAADAAWA